MLKAFKSIFFLLTLLSIVSCSVEKRHYMSGYNINFKNNRHTKTEITKVNTTETFDSDEYPLTSSEDNAIYLPSKSATVKSLRDTCDLIELKDSSKMQVKIIEIRASDIKYRICDSPSDSAYTINKSEVIGIDFSNGLKGEFDSAGKLKPKKEKIYSKQPSRKIVLGDSSFNYSQKIIAQRRGNYKQNDIPLNQAKFWKILKERNDSEIDKLVIQSKQLFKKQKLGLLAIFFGVFALYFPLFAIWFISVNGAILIIISLISLIIMACLIIMSIDAKRQKRKVDQKAVDLYNEPLIQ